MNANEAREQALKHREVLDTQNRELLHAYTQSEISRIDKIIDKEAKNGNFSVFVEMGEDAPFTELVRHYQSLGYTVLQIC
jgi:hypothetical protein